jgi:hypothetical protein
MHPQTLYPKTKQVLENLTPIINEFNFYLAGGTGLALQLGHRKSIDIDLFSSEFPERDLLLQSLKKFEPQIIQEAPGTIDTMICNVQVSFLEYKYPLIESTENFQETPIASLADIACMKLSAVSSRGSKKDFVDLYTILKQTSLKELFTAFEKKFKGVEFQSLHLLKSLTYFTDADKDPEPDYMEPINWEEVKNTLEEQVKIYLKAN